MEMDEVEGVQLPLPIEAAQELAKHCVFDGASLLHLGYTSSTWHYELVRNQGLWRELLLRRYGPRALPPGKYVGVCQ